MPAEPWQSGLVGIGLLLSLPKASWFFSDFPRLESTKILAAFQELNASIALSRLSPPVVIPRLWLAAQRVTGIQASSGALLALVHLPLCWYLVDHLGYLGAAIATSAGNFLRMLWVIFKRLGISWDGTWWRPVGFQGEIRRCSVRGLKLDGWGPSKFC
jgi:hypothetical protein